MCTHLDRVGSTYYFRRVVPLELRPFIRTQSGAARTEWKISLGTKDLETAKRLLPSKRIETDRLIDAARREIGRPAPQEAAGRLSRLMTDTEARRFEHDLDGAEIGYRAQVEKEERQEERAPIREALRIRWKRILRTSTAELTPEEAAVKDLLREREGPELSERSAVSAETVTVSAEERRGLRAKTGPVPAPALPYGSAPMGTSLNKIVDLWAAERKVQEKTKDAHTAVVRWFHERVGTKPVASITKRDILDFKDRLIAEGTSVANTKVKLSRLKALLGWAADNDHVAENVATGITIRDIDAAKNKRREFDLQSLNRIVSTPIYSRGARPVQGRGEAAFWLPILALYTGARLEELGQLRPSDVQEVRFPDADGNEHRAWFLRITEDERDNMRLKNASSEREVPVHPELVRLGFIGFVTASNAQARLFPALKADKYGRLTAKWGEWFGAHIRALGIADKRMVFHSFRHTFKQYARLSGIDEGVQRAIMGHSSGDVADQYGSGQPAFAVVEGIKRYRVPGLAAIERWKAAED